MASTQSFLSELKYESGNTRKMLAQVPQEHFGWQPHSKSMTLVRLAAHIAEIPGKFIADALQTDGLDLATANYKAPTADSSEDLLHAFDENIKRAVTALENASDEDLNKIWTLRRGDHVIFALPVKVVIRNLALNHVIHHRGQLSVFLRLLDISVPGMYGPSADEVM